MIRDVALKEEENIPASPVIVSANISNIKVDGEVVPGLQKMSYKIESGQIEGTILVRMIYEKFDSTLLSGNEKNKPFQLVVELKKVGQSLKPFSFDTCYLRSSSFSMDANGVGISEYVFYGSVKKKLEQTSNIGSSGIRPSPVNTAVRTTK